MTSSEITAAGQTIAIPTDLCVDPLVAVCMWDPTAPRGSSVVVCRVGYADNRAPNIGDAYYPYADVGMLWFREEHGHGCASGMLKRRLFPTADAVSRLVAFLEKELRVDAQGVCVELVDAVQCVVENGEEGTLLLEGEGEGGAHFQPVPPGGDTSKTTA